MSALLVSATFIAVSAFVLGIITAIFYVREKVLGHVHATSFCTVMIVVWWVFLALSIGEIIASTPLSTFTAITITVFGVGMAYLTKFLLDKAIPSSL